MNPSKTRDEQMLTPNVWTSVISVFTHTESGDSGEDAASSAADISSSLII